MEESNIFFTPFNRLDLMLSNAAKEVYIFTIIMKTLILCNGSPPSKQLFGECLEWADLFIAADGGGNVAHSLNTLPDIVIGDLDSFEYPDSESYMVLFDPDQETNDLEKALKKAIDEGAMELIVLGATGKRLDQTLKNLSVMKQFNNSFNSLVYKDNYGDTFILPDIYRKELEPGTQISLFPLSGEVTGIHTEGLKYSLTDEKLMNGVRDGSSNEVVSSPIEITHKEGDLLMFIARER
ncbi:thiamine diphosphokinase [Balneolaceae bacterium YR4-1]|uniref:Thiamine diphosphokinase n=1 Tax=Halalkalibaculum roseum TaxID=2709311 RepID=A0A6M1SZ56_9BACT|nr:thiamine diphosphokinase [Halalkalibaculum roseum]NGP77628.1 thiamine diphosphokinase [Halalkalibaculum roseum]